MKDKSLIREVLGQLLGHTVESFTIPNVEYTVIFDGKWRCNCPDYKYRKGSYIIEWIEEDEQGKKIQKRQTGCKHIAYVLRRLEKLVRAYHRTNGCVLDV
ncbi:hypothetical protein DRN75_02200 [Nanoarchaeota archaeon]|nr:MAG: hypothetical protein DRN75_02200 [Nanoarchaeota archaeon]